MPSHHIVDFDRLPERVKRQIARSIADADSHLREEAPSNTMFYATRGLGLALLALWLYSVVTGDFAKTDADELWDNVRVGTGMALLIGPIAYLALAMRQRFTMSRDFGFPPGQYMFPYTLIDARRPQWQVIDLSQLAGINVVENQVNGTYSHTTYAFSFADAPTRTWRINNRGRADQFGAKLSVLQKAAHDAHQRNDLAALLRLDPFFEIRKNNWNMPQGGALPPAARVRAWLARPPLAAVALALLLAPTVWMARNTAADVVMTSQAKRLNTERAYIWYIQNGWFNVAEMRAAVPRVAFEEVKKKNSVTALRSLVARYPKAGLQADVGKEIHVLYQGALAKFKDQAITSDPALLVTMEKLLHLLEQRGDPKVAIHFTRPSTEALGALDASIKHSEARLGGKKIIPASEHFHNNSAAPREARIVAGLQAAFRTIFANDVLNLQAHADPRLPMLDIAYQIAPSGMIYVSEENNEKAFVGLVARFRAALKVEEPADPWRFEMEVVPPDHFTVNYDLPPGAVASGPPESRVYAVMAERAFDELAVKIRAAFFRPDSAAFKRKGAIAPAAPAPGR